METGRVGGAWRIGAVGRGPEPEEFAARLAKLGIGNDDEGRMNADRLCWMLRWLGQKNVTVQDTEISPVVNPKVFFPPVLAGSRSDWISYEENPVTTEEEM